MRQWDRDGRKGRETLYLNEDKNRTDKWFQALRLQLPARETKYGSIRKITCIPRDVKGNFSTGNEGGKTAMQRAFEAAGYQTEGTQALPMTEALCEETRALDRGSCSISGACS